MNIKVGDYVTRNSYNNDTVFKVIKLKDGIVYLKGAEVRLIADAYLDDLEIVEDVIEDDDIDELEVKDELLERGEYFYLPAKVLHIDGDSEYLNRCLKFYKRNGIMAIGKKINEKNIYNEHRSVNLFLCFYNTACMCTFCVGILIIL